MKITTFIIIIFTIISCNDNKNDDWIQDYIKHEKRKVTTITKVYNYDSGSYSLESIDTTFETFNENGQKIRTYFGFFCDYDNNGKLKAEKRPIIRKVSIDNDNEHGIITRKYYYNNKGLLSKMLFSNECSTDEFTYDINARKKTKVRKWYNEYTDTWSVFTDTMFYGNSNNIISEHSYLQEDVLTISTFTYNDDNTVKSKFDTTITDNQSYQYHSGFNSLYSQTDYKYNSNKELVEEIWSMTDYQTPHLKFTYEYIEEPIKKIK